MSETTKPTQPQPQQQQQQQQQRTKLPKLPKNAIVTKRPLLHPPPPSKYAGPSAQKIIYISTRTPFMSAVSRVDRALTQVERRALQSTTTLLRNENRKKRKFGQYASAADDEVDVGDVARRLADEQKEGEEAREEVLVKATGKAIQKALGVGVWFMKKEGFGVRVKTGSVGAIDDVEVPEEEGQDVGMKDGEVEEVVVPETRLRYASTVEIAVFRT